MINGKISIKKIAIALSITLLIMLFPATNKCFASSFNSSTLKNDPELLQNIIGRLMIQDLQNAVDDYYWQYTDYLPQVEVYAPTSTTKILGITYDNNNNLYMVKFKVEPYVAAHNTIGEDYITFEISGSAEVTVIDFEHIKSYEYPTWLNVKLKKPFPPNK